MGKFFLCLSLAASLHATAIYWSSADAVPLGVGLDCVVSLNNSGMAVGSRNGQAAESSLDSPAEVALGLLYPYSVAAAINSSGQIAGTFEDAHGNLYAFLWTQDGVFTPLGTLGGNMSIAAGINDSGDIVGQSTDEYGNPVAFLWQNGRISRIGDSASYIAVGITDSGQIAYQQDPSPYIVNSAAMGSAASPSLLPLGGQGSYIAGINNAGWVVGQTASGGGFLWTPAGTRNFGGAFQPTAINDQGQVIGAYLGQPAIWTADAGFVPLNLGGYAGVSLAAINDNGQIVGNASDVPEPAPLALCGAGALLLAAGWKKRPPTSRAVSPSSCRSRPPRSTPPAPAN